MEFRILCECFIFSQTLYHSTLIVHVIPEKLGDIFILTSMDEVPLLNSFRIVFFLFDFFLV